MRKAADALRDIPEALRGIPTGVGGMQGRSHFGAVLRKLQLNSRHEAAHWVLSRGLIDG